MAVAAFGAAMVAFFGLQRSKMGEVAVPSRAEQENRSEQDQSPTILPVDVNIDKDREYERVENQQGEEVEETASADIDDTEEEVKEGLVVYINWNNIHLIEIIKGMGGADDATWKGKARQRGDDNEENVGDSTFNAVGIAEPEKYDEYIIHRSVYRGITKYDKVRPELKGSLSQKEEHFRNLSEDNRDRLWLQGEVDRLEESAFRVLRHEDGSYPLNVDLVIKDIPPLKGFFDGGDLRVNVLGYANRDKIGKVLKIFRDAVYRHLVTSTNGCLNELENRGVTIDFKQFKSAKDRDKALQTLESMLSEVGAYDQQKRHYYEAIVDYVLAFQGLTASRPQLPDIKDKLEGVEATYFSEIVINNVDPSGGIGANLRPNDVVRPGPLVRDIYERVRVTVVELSSKGHTK